MIVVTIAGDLLTASPGEVHGLPFLGGQRTLDGTEKGLFLVRDRDDQVKLCINRGGGCFPSGVKMFEQLGMWDNGQYIPIWEGE